MTTQEPVQTDLKPVGKLSARAGKITGVAVAALIVIIVALFLYHNYVSVPREQKASTALAKVQELFADEDYATAAEQCATIIADYNGTDAANLAHLYAGISLANQDKWEEAVAQLEKFSPADDAMISPAAIAALGNAYANTGDIDKAVAKLKEAAEKADKQSIDKANYSISPTFLIQAALLLESQGNDDDALDIYKEVKKKYVRAQQVQSKEIDKYILRLEEK